MRKTTTKGQKTSSSRRQRVFSSDKTGVTIYESIESNVCEPSDRKKGDGQDVIRRNRSTDAASHDEIGIVNELYEHCGEASGSGRRRYSPTRVINQSRAAICNTTARGGRDDGAEITDVADGK